MDLQSENQSCFGNHFIGERISIMQKITPCLWFENQAEEAVNFYTSVFKNSKVNSIARNTDGSVLTISFQLEGLEYLALQGGPAGFEFNESISMSVDCQSQEEVDYLWNRLTADGGEESMCGWLKDKYGLSWQIVPRRLVELVQGPDKARAGRVMQAMLKMRKIEVNKLEEA
jgi:predicted 3-demethylubiquinone-9 3-methyltransferase (glyoxalase superfamily)